MKHFAPDFLGPIKKKRPLKKKREEKDQWKGFRRIPQLIGERLKKACDE